MPVTKSLDATRPTPFPDLYSHRRDQEDIPRVQRRYAVDIDSPQAEELVFAWAAILIAYTGIREDPVLYLDDQLIRVSCSGRVIDSVTVDETCLHHVRKTGVLAKRGDHSECSLYVQISSAGACHLVSQVDIVPAEHLPCIASELATRVRWARGQPNEHFQWHPESGLTLSVLNASPGILDGPQLLHHFFEAHCKGDQTALEYLGTGGKRTSYSNSQINNLAENLSLHLRGALCTGCSADQQIIPILIPQSPALYVAILATLKSGAAFCPLDPDAPIERLKFIVADLSAKVMLVDPPSAEKVTWEGGPEVMVVRTETLTVDGCPDGPAQRANAKKDALAYVMYTSGSTGTPKGVGVPHSAVTQSLIAHERCIPDFNRFLQFAAPTFDVFVFEMFFPLLRGKTLVSSDRQSLLDDLPAIINRMRVDGTVLTPTVVGGLLQKRDHVPGLRVLMTIGEMLTQPIIDEFGDSDGRPGILHAMYGPTEAAIHCTVASKLPSNSKVGIIGQPLNTASAYVVAPLSQDSSKQTSLEILPAGHVGELAIGGHQLASGYLNRPEQTEAAFISTEEHGRVYRTGDKARLLPNGVLECLGRLVADQVKLRGHRLELGEIERVAVSTPGVRHAVATIVDGILIVFCLTSDEGMTVEPIYASCRRWLPAPIIPEDILIVEEIPRLPSGKADKKALEAEYRRYAVQAERHTSDTHTRQSEEDLSGHQLEEEQKIRMVLARLASLEESKIGRNTTIFQMGLDSVKAVKIAADLRDQGFAISAADVLQNTSLSSLANFLASSKEGAKPNLPSFDFAGFDKSERSVLISALEIPNSLVQAVRPCTPVQSGMIAGFINSDGSLYLSHILMKLRHDVSVPRLEETWKAVAEKYMMLRTGFASAKDHQHSFAMLEYKVAAKPIPWQQVNCSPCLTETIEKQRESARRRIMQSLHEPAWQTCVLEDSEHVFLQLSALHALFDAQSLRQILNDVARAYDGHGLAPEVPVEPALGAMLTSTSGNLETHRRFWQSLKDVLPSTEFPNLSPLRSRDGSFLTRSICSSWTGWQLEDRCARQGVTVAAAGQAAWARVLSAYIGQATVAFGVVLSARTVMDEAARLAFPCVTTLPVGFHVESSNLDLLERVMKLNSDIMRHQHVPLRHVKQWIRPDQTPIFTTIFAYQKHSAESLEDIAVWQVVEESLRVDYAISVELEIVGDGQVALRLSFEEDICPPEQAELLLRQLDHALLDTISNPTSPCADLSTAQPNLLSVMRAKEPLIPSDIRLLHQFVEYHASITPENIALEFVEDIGSPSAAKSRWSYAELNTAGDRVCDMVLRQGLRPGDLVAICFEKCPEASFAILGILKAGCGYVALDPDAPVARRRYIIEDSGAKLLLTLKTRRSGLQETAGIPVLPVDRGDIQAQPGDDALRRVESLSPESICYCLYTSGTTGTPKGCEITHANAVQAMLAFQRLFAGRWSAESRWLQFASYHFDVSVLEQFWSWSVGICVTSAPRDVILGDIPGVVRELGITHIDLTPSLARTLHPDEMPGLHDGVFITGGELLKQDIIDAWGPYRCIYNAYGPTEATIGVTMHRRVPANGKPSNIGTQFDNVGTYVLTPDTKMPVLRGAVGELCVSGPLVGNGYRNRQDQTNQRFRYLEKYGERVYCTGDLVRLLHNGDFDYIGRMDEQVKLRGQRLELAEVNQVIKNGVPEVSESTSLVLKHQMVQSEQLVCFVVLGDGQQSGGSAAILWSTEGASLIKIIRDVCRAKLPSYGVPTHIIPLTRIPLSVNHKVDLNRLKQIYQSTTMEDLQRLSQLARKPDSDWSAAEQEVVQVLADFLETDVGEVTRDANMFELGLDSISVIELANMLRHKGFTHAKPSLIMQNTIMEKLVRTVLDRDHHTDSSLHLSSLRRQELLAFSQKHSYKAARALGITPESVDAVLPCTPLQEGMLTASMTSQDALYFNAFYFDLPPDINLAQLRNAWARLADRCDVLRLCFSATDDGFAQVFRKPSQLKIIELDVSSEDMFLNVIERRFDKWVRQDPSACKEPLQILFLRAPSKTLMAVHIFHALYDGISFDLMMQRLREEYHDTKDLNYGPSYRDILPLGPLSVPQGARDFWLQQLDDVQATCLASTPVAFATNEYEVVVKLDYLQEIDEMKRRLNVTYKSLFQASWMTVLRRYFQDHVTVGTVVSGRSMDFEGAELIIGPLFNTLPFSLRFGQPDTWESVVQRCHDFNIASLPYQHTPLRDIQKWCNRSRNQPLFDTLFVFDKDVANDVDDGSPVFGLVESRSRAEYPLAIEVRLQRDEQIVVTLVAQGEALDKAEAISLLDDMDQTLRGIISNPYAKMRGPSGTKSQASEGVNGSASEEGPAPVYMNGTTKDFEWTREASQIRSELSSLASVAETAIDEHTSIFDLGLDSIDAIKLSSRLRQHNIKLAVGNIMRSLSINAMVDSLSKGPEISANGANSHQLKDIQNALKLHLARTIDQMDDVEEVLPTTGLQEAMIAQMVGSQSSYYFNHECLELTLGVDHVRLMKAWEMVIRCTPILRTSFAEIDDPEIHCAYAQVIHRPTDIAWDSITPPVNRSLEQVISVLKGQDKDGLLEKPPLSLTMIHHRGDRYLLFSIAHALYDGWSLHLLHEDVKRAYHGTYRSRPSYKPALEVILQASSPAAADFWRSLLSGAQETKFPTRRIDATDKIEVRHYRELQSKMPAQSIQDFCKAQRATLQGLGHTCWSFVLASYVGAFDVVFGAVLAGRDFEDADQILFPTMNTVPIRAIVHGTRVEMVRYMTKLNTRLTPFQHCPLRTIHASTELEGQELFNTLFIVQRRPETATGDGDQLYVPVLGESDTEYPLCVEMEVVDDRLVWRAASKDTVLDSQGLCDLLENLDVVIDAVINSPDAPAVDLTEKGASTCGLPPFKSIDQVNGQGLRPSKPRVDLQGYSSNWSDHEISIRRVLSLVSKIPEAEIRRDQTAYHLGLDSISAIKASNMLKKRSIKLSVRDLLQASSIPDMAQIAQRQAKENKPADFEFRRVLASRTEALNMDRIYSCCGIRPEKVERVIPATPGQVYLLSVWQITTGIVFDSSFRYKANARLNAQRLDTAWTRLLDASPILRTTFAATGQREIPLVQLVLKEADNPILWVDPDDPGVPSHEDTSIFAPRVRLRAWQQEDATLLELRMLHAYYDAVSLPLIVSHLQALYNGPDATITPTPQLDELLAHSSFSSKASQRKEFWKQHLGTPCPSRVFQDQTPRDHNFARRTEVFRSISLPTSDLRKWTRRKGLSFQSLFLAAYAKTVKTNPSRTRTPTNNDSVIFGIYLANRSHTTLDLSKLAVPTLNFVPLKVHVPSDGHVEAMAQQIQRDLHLMSTPQNSGVSLWEIDEWTGLKLDSFVNLIKLPEDDDEDDRQPNHQTLDGSEEAVKFEPVTSEAQRGRREIITLPSEKLREPEILRDNAVKDSYLPSIDIEARLRNNGDGDGGVVLDIGVFGPTDMVGLDDADRLIQGIERELRGVLHDPIILS